MPLSKELMCSDALCRAGNSNLNFELYSEVTTNSLKLGSAKWGGAWEGIILFLSVIFHWGSAFSMFHIKAFFALTWKKLFDRAYCLVK